MDIRNYVDLSARTDVKYPCQKSKLTNEEKVFNEQLLHASLGLTTESAEFADQIKRHTFYQKNLDKVNLIEELGDLMWYFALACRALKVDPEEILIKNIEKLKNRYPEGFTPEDYDNRKIDQERKILSKTLLEGMANG